MRNFKKRFYLLVFERLLMGGFLVVYADGCYCSGLLIVDIAEVLGLIRLYVESREQIDCLLFLDIADEFLFVWEFFDRADVVLFFFIFFFGGSSD